MYVNFFPLPWVENFANSKDWLLPLQWFSSQGYTQFCSPLHTKVLLMHMLLWQKNVLPSQGAKTQETRQKMLSATLCCESFTMKSAHSTAGVRAEAWGTQKGEEWQSGREICDTVDELLRGKLSWVPSHRPPSWAGAELCTLHDMPCAVCDPRGFYYRGCIHSANLAANHLYESDHREKFSVWTSNVQEHSLSLPGQLWKINLSTNL